MAFHLMLFKDDPQDPADASLLWSADPAAQRGPALDPDARRAIAETLTRIDGTLDRSVPEEDGSISVVSSRGIGIDWHVGPTRVIAQPQVAGVKPAIAEATFGRLLDAVASLRSEHGLTAWSPELGQRIDPEQHREALARVWLRHCDDAAKAHLEATRTGGNMGLVGALVMLGLLVAFAATPAAAHPMIVVPIAILLAFGLIIGIARRARRRGGDNGD